MEKIKIGQGEISELETAVMTELDGSERKNTMEVKRLVALDYCGLLIASGKAKKKLLELYDTIIYYERLPLPEKTKSYL